MVKNKYDSLVENDVFENAEPDYNIIGGVEGSGRCDCEELIHKKKHGVWCRLLTHLHLKTKRAHTADSDKESKNTENRRLHLSKLKPKFKLKNKRKKRPLNDEKSGMEDPVDPGNNYAPLPEVLGEKYSYRGRRVDFALLPDRYELLEEVECDESSTMNDSGIHEGSVSSSDDDDSLCAENLPIVGGDKDRAVIAKHLKKRWNGKRAKSTRKYIRRTPRHAWKYLQTGLENHYGMLDFSQIVTAFQSGSATADRR